MILTPSSARSKEVYECGGALEASVWNLWDSQGREFLREQLLDNRFIQRGDTYALYDIQNYFHNTEAMAERCGRTDRLIQLADDLSSAYDRLEPLSGDLKGTAWICRGGEFCNERNRLLNKEVVLVSVQGLGLMSSLADDLANSRAIDARTHSFIDKTAEVSARHLLRWSSGMARQDWRRLVNAKSEDVRDGSSALFFSDKDLWQLAIYANLAGIYSARPALHARFEEEIGPRQQMVDSIRLLLQLFKARTTHTAVLDPLLGRSNAAQIDRGFWRLYAENRFAGYIGDPAPAVCTGWESGKTAKVIRDIQEIPVVDDLGWDISHARRLVHALRALEKNRAAMIKIYGLSADELPAKNLREEFAVQLISRVWNGDKQVPLFTNYWSGANGWYRVAYDNKTGQCNTGYPPFGLSASFATGGYATWSDLHPMIETLARKIYELTQSQSEAGLGYTEKNFSALAPRTNTNTRMLTQLMFWSSLVK